MALNRWRCSLVLLLTLAWASAAFAQIRSATITGAVTDPTKAVVPGATVVVTNQDTNSRSELVTNEDGLFTANYLTAGTYSIEVSLPGFATFRRTGIAVATAGTTRVTVELAVSKVGETVDVSAEAPMLQTDRTSVSGAVGAEMIEALPNITQNPLAYAYLQAGALPRNAAADTQSANSFGIGVDGRRQFSAVGINGGRAFTNDIQLDGLPVMGGGYNEASVVPNTEGLQEVRVISNNFSAEYGRGQAVISMSTKSGSNAFHGQGVYMMRHEGLDANSFSNNAQAIPKREFRVNDAGGSIGGPILRDKLFFFSSYHGLRNNQNATTAADGSHRARTCRQLQPVVHPRRERQSGPGAHLRPVQRRAGGAGSLPPGRASKRDHPQPRSVRAADVQLLPDAEPHAGRRLQHEQLRSDHADDGAASQLEQPRRFPSCEALDLRQRRHLVGRDPHAAPVRHGAVQRRRWHPRRQESLFPDGRCDRRQPDRSWSTCATA